MTLFLLCQMINDVDFVLLHDGCGRDRCTLPQKPAPQRPGQLDSSAQIIRKHRIYKRSLRLTFPTWNFSIKEKVRSLID